MDAFGFEKSVLINLQLEEIQNQFHNSCSCLNILENFQNQLHNGSQAIFEEDLKAKP